MHHRAIQIGYITLASNVLLAPMSGVTDLPFRRLVRQFGDHLVTSEMIASRAVIDKTKESLKKGKAALESFPVSVQLAGCDADTMAEAAKLCEDAGADIIDINYGCPVKKVVNGFAGSAMMKDEKRAGQVLEAVVGAVSVPVTLKMRTGWNAANRNAPSIARLAYDAGVKMITVHGRTRCQMYNGRADWEFIRQVKEAVPLPIIANGDITTAQEAEQCLEQSGADGVMIGRGMYGRPWLLREISAHLAGSSAPDRPSRAQQKETLLQHYSDMLSFYGREAGMRIGRKHVGWYSRGMKGSAEFRNNVMRQSDPDIVLSMIEEYYG